MPETQSTRRLRWLLWSLLLWAGAIFGKLIFLQLRDGSGAGRPRLPGLDPQSPEEVAEAILDLVITGAESAVLVPDRLRQRRP